MTSFSFARLILNSALLSVAVFTAFVSVANAQNAAPSEFDKKAPEFDTLQTPASMSDADRAREVAATMQKQCDAQGRCWLLGTDGKGSSWTVTFSGGIGSRNYATGTTVINLDNNQNNGDGNEPYVGVSISYRSYVCESNLRVAPAMKRLLETYQYAGINDDGSTKRTVSPAEHAMNSLYVTLAQKLETCRNNGQQ